MKNKPNSYKVSVKFMITSCKSKKKGMAIVGCQDLHFGKEKRTLDMVAKDSYVGHSRLTPLRIIFVGSHQQVSAPSKFCEKLALIYCSTPRNSRATHQSAILDQWMGCRLSLMFRLYTATSAFSSTRLNISSPYIDAVLHQLLSQTRTPR